VQLGSLCRFQGGSAFPRDEQGKVSGEFPFIKVSDMTLPRNAKHIVVANNWVDQSTVTKLRLKPSPAGSIVFAKIGEGLKAERLRILTRPTILDNNMMAAVPSSNADASFLFFLLEHLHIADYAEGSALPYLRASDLSNLPVALPVIDEQRGIAATLGALDDKIESNRRSQVTGEKLIRSLVTAALERSTGEVGVLRDYCNLIKEPARIGALTADLHYIAFEHMPRGSIFLDNWGNAEGLGSDKSYFQVGDILFGKLRPYFKKVGIAPVDGVCSTDILVLRPIRKADTALVAVVASSDPLIDSLSAAATGTRMPRASWKDLASWPVPEMTTLERDELADQVAPLVERLTAMTHETKRLQLLRDTLLPELLSGRIRVPEAHETVQEVIA
jgi:type I restriction enzyme S subunit